jgi:DNA-binding MarR family transcriptional regulator
MSTCAAYSWMVKQKSLSPRELRVWHAFKLMGDYVLAQVGSDIERATGLSGAEFGVLSRLAGMGRGQLRQQKLAESMGWHKSRLSHQLTRMEVRGYLVRNPAEEVGVMVSITEAGRDVLAAALPVHGESVRKHLLDRLSEKQEISLVQISTRVIDPDEDD